MALERLMIADPIYRVTVLVERTADHAAAAAAVRALRFRLAYDGAYLTVGPRSWLICGEAARACVRSCPFPPGVLCVVDIAPGSCAAAVHEAADEVIAFITEAGRTSGLAFGYCEEERTWWLDFIEPGTGRMVDDLYDDAETRDLAAAAGLGFVLLMQEWYDPEDLIDLLS